MKKIIFLLNFFFCLFFVSLSFCFHSNRLRKVKMDQRKLMDNANTITDMAKVSELRLRGLKLITSTWWHDKDDNENENEKSIRTMWRKWKSGRREQEHLNTYFHVWSTFFSSPLLLYLPSRAYKCEFLHVLHRRQCQKREIDVKRFIPSCRMFFFCLQLFFLTLISSFFLRFALFCFHQPT